MSSKKQTAVERLIQELGEYFPHEVGGIELVVNKAKQMEKEQMKDAVLSQCTTNESLRKIFENQFEQYYTETYGGNNGH